VAAPVGVFRDRYAAPLATAPATNHEDEVHLYGNMLLFWREEEVLQYGNTLLLCQSRKAQGRPAKVETRKGDLPR
jgi:hypothetical protein